MVAAMELAAGEQEPMEVLVLEIRHQHPQRKEQMAEPHQQAHLGMAVVAGEVQLLLEETEHLHQEELAALGRHLLFLALVQHMLGAEEVPVAKVPEVLAEVLAEVEEGLPAAELLEPLEPQILVEVAEGVLIKQESDQLVVTAVPVS